MKRYSQRGAQSSMAELNITPLLDLAFVLLIIFVITTPVMEQSINVRTPDSTTARVEVDPGDVRTISLDASGGLFLENEPIDLESLEARLAAIKAATPDIAVGIRADRALAYEKVIDVIDAIQRAGISRFGLLTRPEEPRR